MVVWGQKSVRAASDEEEGADGRPTFKTVHGTSLYVQHGLASRQSCEKREQGARGGVSLLDGSLLSSPSPSRVLSSHTLTQQLPWPPPSPPRQNRNPQPQPSPTPPPPFPAHTPPYPPRPRPPPLPTSRHRSSSTSTQSLTSSSTAPNHRPPLPLWPPTPNPVLGAQERRAVGWAKGGELGKALGKGRARRRRSAPCFLCYISPLRSFPLLLCLIRPAAGSISHGIRD